MEWYTCTGSQYQQQKQLTSDLQLSDGADIRVIHYHVARSKVTENMMECVWLSERGECVWGQRSDCSLCRAVQSMECNHWLCQQLEVGVAFLEGGRSHPHPTILAEKQLSLGQPLMMSSLHH